MKKAKSGDTVTIHFSGQLNDISTFGYSKEKKALQFEIGNSNIIPGLEEAIVGMTPGQSKTIRIPSDKAFGPYIENSVRVVNSNQCPSDIQTGQQLKMVDENNRTTIVRVMDISKSKVTLDTNHPLAGQNLTAKIKLLEIQ